MSSSLDPREVFLHVVNFAICDDNNEDYFCLQENHLHVRQYKAIEIVVYVGFLTLKLVGQIKVCTCTGIL